MINPPPASACNRGNTPHEIFYIFYSLKNGYFSAHTDYRMNFSHDMDPGYCYKLTVPHFTMAVLIMLFTFTGAAGQERDRWEWQRARLYGTIEDLYPFSYIQPWLLPMLENAGAHVMLPRERDLQPGEVIVDLDGSSGDSEITVTGGVFYNRQSRMASRDLSDIIQTQIVQDIRLQANRTWTRRGLWDRQYSEAWRPHVPSLLLELLSHQNLADLSYGLDPRFRSLVSRAIYKGILRYLADQHGREAFGKNKPDPDRYAGGNEIRIYRYATGMTSAGILKEGNHRVVALGFPFETIICEKQRAELIGNIMEFFNQ